MVIFSIILTAINLVLMVVWYRNGGKSSYDDLVKAYKRACQENAHLWATIDKLEKRLKNSCDGKEASDD